MPPQKTISPVEATILFYLRDEAVDGCGWLRRGVRGWRLYDEIRAATGEYISERLPGLARHGLLDRVDVVELGRERPTLLYRISEAGARAVAELEGRPVAPLPSPGADDRDRGNLFVPARSWAALATLRRHAVDRIGPVRLDAHGWMTAHEVHEAHPLVVGHDVGWLLRRGLVERRQVPAPSRPLLPLTYYRVSEWGLRTEQVDAVPSPSGTVERMEARVREEAGPTRARPRAARHVRGSRRGAAAARGR